MRSNFLLGTIRLTEAARMVLKRQPYDLLCRHAIGEHGLVTKTEAAMNIGSMKHLGVIVSRYTSDPTRRNVPKIKITTQATWQDTIIETE